MIVRGSVCERYSLYSALKVCFTPPLEGVFSAMLLVFAGSVGHLQPHAESDAKPRKLRCRIGKERALCTRQRVSGRAAHSTSVSKPAHVASCVREGGRRSDPSCHARSGTGVDSSDSTRRSEFSTPLLGNLTMRKSRSLETSEVSTSGSGASSAGGLTESATTAASSHPPHPPPRCPFAWSW